MLLPLLFFILYSNLFFYSVSFCPTYEAVFTAYIVYCFAIHNNTRNQDVMSIFSCISNVLTYSCRRKIYSISQEFCISRCYNNSIIYVIQF